MTPRPRRSACTREYKERWRQQTLQTQKVGKTKTERKKKKNILGVRPKRQEKQVCTDGEEAMKKKGDEQDVECKHADSDPTETKPVSPESQLQK